MKENKQLLLAAFLMTTLVMSACTVPSTVTVETPVKETPTNDVQANPDTKTDTQSEVTPTPVAKSDAQVDFHAPVKLDSATVLKNYLASIRKKVDTVFSSTMSDEEAAKYYKESFDFYNVGTVKVEPYKGYKLLVLQAACEGPCFSSLMYRFVWDEKSGELTMLKNHSFADYVATGLEEFSENADTKLTLTSLQSPKFLALPDGTNMAKLNIEDIDINLGAAMDFVALGKVAFEDPKVGKVYFSDNNDGGCLFVTGPDSVVRSYGYDSGLLSESEYQQIDWKEKGGETAATSYAPLLRGCGIGASCYFVANINDSDVVEITQTNKGIKLYEAKDKTRVENIDVANTKATIADLNNAYNTYRDMYEYGDKKTPLMTYEQYLATNPVLYWQDPFGRFSAIIRREFVPPAECGKPVIYLYPEKESEVSVKVGIDQFTVTEPAYGENGWKVLAKPNGELTNLADGLTYPYLFWEGTSKKELAMSSGFMVRKSELPSFLENSLSKMGLNAKESADFREFWLPKMQATDMPYLLVSFAGTQEFNKIAPLTIEPKPDTLIRVFMYYQPMASKMNLPEQKLTAIPRHGFTVIEWGGTSSDGWQVK